MTTGIGSGLGASYGSCLEGTWGTWQASTKWMEILSETLEKKPMRVDGQGLYNGGMVERDVQRQETSSTVDGDVIMNGFIKGLGQHLAVLCGDTGIPPVQQGATTAYLQTHTLGDTRGDSMAIQLGRPSVDGTINQYNYFGLKITKAVFECGLDELLKCTFSFDGKGVEQASAYGTPTYQGGNATFAFQMAQLKMGAFGAETQIDGNRKWTMTIERPHATKRFYTNGTGLKSEQVLNAFNKITVDLETDYINDAAYCAQFVADAAQSMIMKFTSPLMAGTALPFFISFAVPRLRWVSEGPKVAGPGELQPKMQLVGRFDGTNAPVTIAYQSTDTTL
jgi:hypothetical protein